MRNATLPGENKNVVNVFFDSNNSADKTKGNGIANQDGTYGREPEIGLAHELLHAQSMLAGTNNENKVEAVNPDWLADPEFNTQGKVVEFSVEEVENRQRENKIRKEQKVPLRADLKPL